MPGSETWAGALARFALTTFEGDIPDDVLERAALHILDTLACAAGAHDSRPVEVTRGVIAGSAPAEATVFFGGGKASVLDAVLVNGTAVRYLDANDVFLGAGPGGHPSDNIPVATAVAERAGATGHELLAAVTVAYELVARVRNCVYRRVPGGSEWHEASISGIVAAVVTALLAGADAGRTAQAISIGGSSGYTLREVRGTQISMLKASANAVVARHGVTAAMLALGGMTGPPLVFEGEGGLVRTFGGQPHASMVEQMCAPPEWAIRRVSVKPYPAIGTGQAAIAAAAGLVAEHGRLAPDDVAGIRIGLPDTAWTRHHRQAQEERRPRTRESADHSIPFLVCVALLEGAVHQHHYDRERWLDGEVQRLMALTTIQPDPGLAEYAEEAFPAFVEVELRGGGTLRHAVPRPPGSPGAPWGRTEIVEKFATLDRAGLSRPAVERIADATLALDTAADVRAVLALIGAPGGQSRGAGATAKEEPCSR